MISFYKRKIEYEIVDGRRKKLFDNANTGSFEKYSLKNMQIMKLDKASFNQLINSFDKANARFEDIINTALAESSCEWSFSLVFDFKAVNNNDKITEVSLFFVSVCLSGITLDFISVSSANDFARKASEIKQKYQLISLDEVVNIEITPGMPVVFHNSAAASLAHEVLGHVFEVDNYFRFHYHKAINAVAKIVNLLLDDPSIPFSPGFYLNDDMGLPSYKTTIIENGALNSLIGCRGDLKVTNSLRREDYSKPCLPRMSNLIVVPQYNRTTLDTKPFLIIHKLSKCYIHHMSETVEFNVDFATLNTENDMFAIKPFRLTQNIYSLLSSLTPIEGGDMQIRPVLCSKQGQIINCGALTPDWVISYE